MRRQNYSYSALHQDAGFLSCCFRFRRRMALRMRLGHGRMLEIFKLLLAGLIGFSIRTVFDASSHRYDSDCQPCASLPPQDILKDDIQVQLREPFKPKTIYDVLRYDYFNSTYILNNFDDDPKISLLGHQKSDIRDIVQQTITLFNSGRSKIWKIDKLINGYRRFDALRGEEYVLDMDLVQPETKDPRGIAQTEKHRFSVVKPFSSPQMLQDELLTGSKMVHFVVPVSGAVTERFEIFLKNFEDVCLKNNERVYLLIVLFTSKTGVSRSRAEAIKNAVDLLHQRYRRAHIRLIKTNKDFNRAMGLDLGVKQLPPETLVFFCDSDVSFTHQFIERCRQNAILEKQVYYPIVFGQYNPGVIKAFAPKDRSKNLLDINKHTGHWVHYGFGMACMFAQDYRTVGGFTLDRHGWGGEDVDLYLKHVRSKLKVFRAMDPDLIHRYHDRSCSPKLPVAQYRMCIDSSAETYGSKQQLAKKLAAIDKLQAAVQTTTHSPFQL